LPPVSKRSNPKCKWGWFLWGHQGRSRAHCPDGALRNRGRAAGRGMAQQPACGALDASHVLARPPVSTTFTKAPARPDGQALARRTARLFRVGYRSDRGGGPARGVAHQQASGALDPSHTHPRSPVSTNFTQAPARPDGQALARRATHLIPGGVLEPQRARACPWDGAATGKRCALSMPYTSPPTGQHQLHQSASPLGRAGARPACYALDSGRSTYTRGRGAARGVALQQASGALDPRQTPPRPPVSTNSTKAPARRNGQALARRTACLIPGRVCRDSKKRTAGNPAFQQVNGTPASRRNPPHAPFDSPTPRSS